PTSPAIPTTSKGSRPPTSPRGPPTSRSPPGATCSSPTPAAGSPAATSPCRASAPTSTARWSTNLPPPASCPSPSAGSRPPAKASGTSSATYSPPRPHSSSRAQPVWPRRSGPCRSPHTTSTSRSCAGDRSTACRYTVPSARSRAASPCAETTLNPQPHRYHGRPRALVRSDQPMEGAAMTAVVTMKQLLEAGVHFGHQTRRWNPKMKRFIHGDRNGIYIIDLQQTLQRIEVAYSFVRDTVAEGGTVLFVGTKKQAQGPVQSYAEKCGMPYVNERWLGGMLTNFETMAKRVSKMKEYQRMRDSGEFEAMPKKEALLISREPEKLERNLGGI